LQINNLAVLPSTKWEKPARMLPVKAHKLQERQDQTKLETMTLCTVGTAAIANKQQHESMYVYVREVLVASQNSHRVFGAENKSLGETFGMGIQGYEK
jgi:predicted dienelactone hydrolase